MGFTPDKKVLFIHIPKNAGTSIKKALNITPIGGHYSCDYYQKTFPEKFNSAYKFTIVRNPWDRFVSCYEYAKMEESFWHTNTNRKDAYFNFLHEDYNLVNKYDFNEFIEKYYDCFMNNKPFTKSPVWKAQTDFILSPDDKMMVDKIYYYNNLKELIFDLEEILNKKIVFPYINQTKKEKNYKIYYNNKSMNLISKIYKKEIDIFKFNF